MSLFRRKDVSALQTEVAADHSLKRTLGPVNLVALGIGAIIGAGIFVLTGQAAANYAGPAIVYSFILAGTALRLRGALLRRVRGDDPDRRLARTPTATPRSASSSAGSCPTSWSGRRSARSTARRSRPIRRVATAQRLAQTWADIERSDVFAGSLFGRLATLARTRTHLHGNDALRATLTEALPIALIEDLPVRFECVAACIEAAAEHWFTAGPLVDAVLASAAVPGILPPVEIGGEHFIDGGIVNSIPVDRAVALGADRIFVMHVGRVDRPLEPPRWPWEVGVVAFEIARRHRFLGDSPRCRTTSRST